MDEIGKVKLDKVVAPLTRESVETKLGKSRRSDCVYKDTFADAMVWVWDNIDMLVAQNDDLAQDLEMDEE